MFGISNGLVTMQWVSVCVCVNMGQAMQEQTGSKQLLFNLLWIDKTFIAMKVEKLRPFGLCKLSNKAQVDFSTIRLKWIKKSCICSTGIRFESHLSLGWLLLMSWSASFSMAEWVHSLQGKQISVVVWFFHHHHHHHRLLPISSSHSINALHNQLWCNDVTITSAEMSLNWTSTFDDYMFPWCLYQHQQ